MTGKATVTDRKDMRIAMIDLCCKPREIEMRPQTVALVGLGIREFAHVFLSRASIGFIDEMCIQKGIVESLLFFRPVGM